MDDLAASVDGWCACVGGSTARDFFGANTLGDFTRCHHGNLLGAVLGLSVLNKEHGVAVALYVRGLQLCRINDSNAAFGQVVLRELDLNLLTCDTLQRLLARE